MQMRWLSESCITGVMRDGSDHHVVTGMMLSVVHEDVRVGVCAADPMLSDGDHPGGITDVVSGRKHRHSLSLV